MTLPRRDFLASSAGAIGGGWLWLHLPALTLLTSCARDAAREGAAFEHFSAAEGTAMRSFAARIVPSTAEGPGAEEAGAAWFADAALAGPLEGMSEPVREGLADLDRRAQRAHGVRFAAASEAQQDAIIADVADSQFFFLGRLLVVMGTFGGDAMGGNRDHAGFAILDMEHAQGFQPPFGHYDAEYARNGSAS